MKIRKNVPVDRAEKPREKHPFVNMGVDDVIDIKDRKAWAKISKYAHTIASKKKWVIHTLWLHEKKIGRVRRVS